MKKSADQRYPRAEVRYGELLANGDGGDVDFVAPAEFYNWAADHGNTRGQMLYSLALQDGTGVSIDLALAPEYGKKAADQGIAPAQFFSGGTLEQGRSVEIDLVAASVYYERAADQGDVLGQMLYVRDLQSGKWVDVDFVSAASRTDIYYVLCTMLMASPLVKELRGIWLWPRNTTRGEADQSRKGGLAAREFDPVTVSACDKTRGVR
jgi:TPR repeat protein